MKIELQFPLTEGEKEFVRHLLDVTASVEDNGGQHTPTLLATPKGGVVGNSTGAHIQAVPDEEAEAPAEPKAEAAPKARKSKPAKVEAAPEPVEDDEEDDIDESVDNDDTDYIELATDKAVELVQAKDKATVREALKVAGVKRVSEVKDQETAKVLYEALIA